MTAETSSHLAIRHKRMRDPLGHSSVHIWPWILLHQCPEDVLMRESTGAWPMSAVCSLAHSSSTILVLWVLGGASLPVACTVCLWTYCPWICLIPFWTCWYCLPVADVPGHHCGNKFQKFSTISRNVSSFVNFKLFLLVSVNASHSEQY